MATRALQLHPTVPSLYILAASHELNSLSTSAARTLLQRGIRLNPDSIQLWTEYVKMELGFIEGLRRRWSVLGLDQGSDMNGKQRERAVADETGIEPSLVEDLDNGGDENISSFARQEIMDGAIVKTVMSNAARGE
jgi:U3 small nucleolar RNA-associated protein 6